MAAFDLASRHVDDMAEQPAERRPQNMQDLETGRRERRLRPVARRCDTVRGAAAKGRRPKVGTIGRGSPMRGP